MSVPHLYPESAQCGAIGGAQDSLSAPGVWTSAALVLNPTLSWMCCVTMAKLPNLSEPWFSGTAFCAHKVVVKVK